MDTIHIIEPTLATETGHCYSFVNSFCKASHGVHLCLWVSRYANISFSSANVQIKHYFDRYIRRLQCFFLYKKLLCSDAKIFISTASISDLMLLNWASRDAVKKRKVYLYFHWLNMSDKKFKYLEKLSRLQPNVVMLGPTASVVKVFEEAGFKYAQIVPYPISTQTNTGKSECGDFKGLLYAGAARQDKGFSHIVDLVEYMRGLELQIPFKLQNSPNHHGQYDPATKADIRRLDRINYPYLELIPETLTLKKYTNLFCGMICIQLYNPELFADRISGVTLDALSSGSPIVTTAGSWIARMVQRFNAGIIVDDLRPEIIMSAVQAIIFAYPQYSENAHTAGLILQHENSAEFLFSTLIE